MLSRGNRPAPVPVMLEAPGAADDSVRHELLEDLDFLTHSGWWPDQGHLPAHDIPHSCGSRPSGIGAELRPGLLRAHPPPLHRRREKSGGVGVNFHGLNFKA